MIENTEQEKEIVDRISRLLIQKIDDIIDVEEIFLSQKMTPKYDKYQFVYDREYLYDKYVNRILDDIFDVLTNLSSIYFKEKDIMNPSICIIKLNDGRWRIKRL